MSDWDWSEGNPHQRWALASSLAKPISQIRIDGAFLFPDVTNDCPQPLTTTATTTMLSRAFILRLIG